MYDSVLQKKISVVYLAYLAGRLVLSLCLTSMCLETMTNRGNENFWDEISNLILIYSLIIDILLHL